MQIVSFTIKNFRGIKNAKVDLLPSGAGVFTLIGLNESGKTTVLEAISTFQVRGGDEKSLYQSKPVGIDPSSFVPKHEKATFTGDIVVTAKVKFEDNERERAIEHAEKQSGSKIDRSSIPDEFEIIRGYQFSNGDEVKRISSFTIKMKAKHQGRRKIVDIENDHKVWISFVAMVNVFLPEIVYFPTFLFELPEKIILNPSGKEAASDKLYRTIIENVGQSLASAIDVEKALVDRIVSPETPGEIFLGLFSLSNNRQQQIESAINQMSHHLSTTVLDSWSKIFGGTTGDREIRLKLGVDKHPDDTPRVYVQFTVRDGTQTYDIGERSTGFRWFFSFLLFTLYRGRATSSTKTIFLLDEPASNLHAGAQAQLLESFPKIASNGNQIMYSTHSHYLINPEWLDQAFIISNSAMEYDDLLARPKSASRHTDVDAVRYRAFVGNNPDKITYFQPVLDRLQVVPSRLDSLQPSVLVEGKGDYLILKHGLRSLKTPGDYAIIPTRGADHFEELMGILLGWGINFALCCDDDTSGKKAVAEFRDNWGMEASRVFTLAEVDTSLSGKAIEGMLEDADRKIISDYFGIAGKPSKSHIQLFFSEDLARGAKTQMSKSFLARVSAFDRKVREALQL
jgi:ABC-type Mn2+/Zn2+ transport system ATPase subunit